MKKIVMGIDPGISNCGVGIIEQSKKGMQIFHTTIKTSNRYRDKDRMGIISKELNVLIDKYKPSKISTEKIFVFKNLQSVIGVAGIIGVINSIATHRNIPVIERTPNDIKKSFTGNNKADKNLIINSIKFILNIDYDLIDHEADALTMALLEINKVY